MALSKSDVGSESSAVATVASAAAGQTVPSAVVKSESVIDAVLKLLSSVRFGLVMLGMLLTCCMIGMLIMQGSVEGFQKYYLALSPAKGLMYGRLVLFDIYPAWYFSWLLAIIGVNL